MNSIKNKPIDLQKSIGNILRYGVLAAITTSLIGAIILFSTHANTTVDYSSFQQKNNTIFTVFQQTLTGITEGDGESIIFLGVFILFLTPVIRLFLSLISFLLEKDWLYTFISFIVVAIIVFSVSFGFSH